MIPAIAIPALIALVVKLGLVGYSLRLPAKNIPIRLVVVLLVAFALHNLAEFLALCFYRGEITRLVEGVAFAYMALIIPPIALTLHACLRLSFDSVREGQRTKLELFLYVLPFVLLSLLLTTDKLVAGFQPFHNTLLRIPGPLYILFEIYLPGYLLIALSLLVYGVFKADRPPRERARSELWLVALLPPALLGWYLIIANHFEVAKITSTIYLPIPWLLYLTLATYATFGCRLVDIGFFIPGSRTRRHKTEFYRRVQRLIREISDVSSVQELLNHVAHTFRGAVALFGGLRPLIATKEREKLDLASEKQLLQFPYEALQKVDTFVVVDEIADSHPELHSLMKLHQVDAIVPFRSEHITSPHWLLFGAGFNDKVYTPRDFKVVTPLFDRIAEYFLHSSKLMRSRLGDATEDIRDLRKRLALAWDELARLRAGAAAAASDNKQLWAEKAALLRRQFLGTDERLPYSIVSGDETLEEYLAETERQIVMAAIKYCNQNKREAARLLGVSVDAMNRIVKADEGKYLD